MSITPLLNRCVYKSSTALALVGSPGHGKTQMVEKFAKRNGFPMVKLIASSMDETDAAGVMVARDGKAVTLSPQWVDFLGERGILFLDEVNCARREVQDTLLTIVQSRHMPNGDRLGKGVMIIAAMNPSEMCDNYEMSPAMKTRFMWCRHRLSMAQWVAWFTGQSEDESVDLPAPKEYQDFETWSERFRSDREFESDKKALLYEAVNVGFDFTPDELVADKELATCPRGVGNLMYWSRNALEAVQWASAFIDEDQAAILRSIPVTAYKNVGNSVFSNNRTQTEVNGEETELIEQRKELFGAIDAEVKKSRGVDNGGNCTE